MPGEPLDAHVDGNGDGDVVWGNGNGTTMQKRGSAGGGGGGWNGGRGGAGVEGAATRIFSCRPRLQL